MLSDLEAVKVAVTNAKCPEDVFGRLAGASAADLLVALKKAYLKVVPVVHPDHQPGASHDVIELANQVFSQLTEWKTKAESKIKTGTYGDNKPHAPPEPKPTSHAPQVIQTPKRRYIVTDLIAQGDLADLYRCTYTEGSTEHHAVFKLVQSAADNDLAENESKVLSAMYPQKQVEERFYRYLPKPIDSFLLKGDRGANRRVNVIQLADGYVSMADVLKEYPRGLDYRDVVWMFKRSLAGLWYAHRQKLVVHGAVLPTHILVHPTGHGAKIVDWCYAVQNWEDGKGRIKAISKVYRNWYAPEVLEKKAPTPQTDLYMLGKCVVALLGGSVETNQMPDTVPKQIRAFVNSMLIPAQHRRPDDASTLHEELDELLNRVVGKPKYRPLAMPTV